MKTFTVKPFAQSGTAVVSLFILGPGNFPRQKFLLQKKEHKLVDFSLLFQLVEGLFPCFHINEIVTLLPVFRYLAWGSQQMKE